MNLLPKVTLKVGFPPEFRVTVYVRKFFPFPLWKRFRKTGIPEYRSGNFPEISGFRNNWYHNYIKVLHIYICKYNTNYSNTNNIWMNAGK